MNIVKPNMPDKVWRAVVVTLDDALGDILSTLLAEQSIEIVPAKTVDEADLDDDLLVTVIVECYKTFEDAVELASQIMHRFPHERIVIVGEYDRPVRVDHDKKEITVLTLNRMELFDLLPQRLKRLRDEVIEIARNSQVCAAIEAGSYIFGSCDTHLMRKVEQIQQSGTDISSIFITGEHGVGKQRLAQHLHNCRNGAGQPFISINCFATPKAFLEQLIVGEKNDFPGGWYEAKGGTLYIEEAGAMATALQKRITSMICNAKGTDAPLVILSDADKSCLNKSLQTIIGNYMIDIAPLRERKADIIFLTEKFIENLNTTNNSCIKGISDEAMRALSRYPWPGNGGELESVLEGTLVMIQDGEIKLQHLPRQIRSYAGGEEKEKSRI